MICPKCKAEGSRTVKDTVKRDFATYRECYCKVCHTRFYTKEAIVNTDEVIAKFRQNKKNRAENLKARKAGLTSEQYNQQKDTERNTPKFPTRPLF